MSNRNILLSLHHNEFVGVVMGVVNSFWGAPHMCSHKLPEGEVLSLKALQKSWSLCAFHSSFGVSRLGASTSQLCVLVYRWMLGSVFWSEGVSLYFACMYSFTFLTWVDK